MNLSPKQIVYQLDKYIIGQDEAKKAVAIALRYRYRRAQLPQIGLARHRALPLESHLRPPAHHRRTRHMRCDYAYRS